MCLRMNGIGLGQRITGKGTTDWVGESWGPVWYVEGTSSVV